MNSNFREPNHLEFILISLIFFSGPLAFLTFRPFVNFFLVDIVMLVFIFIYALSSIKTKTSVSAYPIFSLILFCISYFLSGFLSETIEDPFVPIAQYLLIITTIITFSSYTLSDRKLKKLIDMYLLGMSLSIIVSYLAYNDIIFNPNINYFSSGRFNGVWGNPNAMAKEMINVIMVCLASLMLTKKSGNSSKTYSIFLVILIFLSLYLILTSSSFGGVFFLILCILFLFYTVYVHSDNRSKILFLSCAFILVMVSFYSYSYLYSYLPDKFVDRVLGVDDISSAGSGSEKLFQILYGLELFLSNPLFGVGMENGRHYNEVSNITSAYSIPFHSFYITAMVEGGILSIVSFFMIFLFFYSRIKSNFKYGPILLVILIAFLINLIVNNNIFNRYVWFPVLLCTFLSDGNKNRSASL
ncbi:TPA: O-antigen ligase family protein [Vibrio vulnificus]|nr:hypothetical protein [Vibrio vulnificus]HDY7535613.1 O-antigen ligase family protein [Vibrio vulnificus]HDY8076099.1 O-antigen ligase family protein [Vibrio vulnificus]